MIRLRMVRLRPKILRPVRHLPPTRALDSTSVLESRLSNYDFPARYLLEGLTTAGIIGIMEVNGLMEALEDYRRGLWPLLLRGLFTRNLSKKRRIDKVLKGTLNQQGSPVSPHSLSRRCRWNNPAISSPSSLCHGPSMSCHTPSVFITASTN